MLASRILNFFKVFHFLNDFRRGYCFLISSPLRFICHIYPSTCLISKWISAILLNYCFKFELSKSFPLSRPHIILELNIFSVVLNFSRQIQPTCVPKNNTELIACIDIIDKYFSISIISSFFVNYFK